MSSWLSLWGSPCVATQVAVAGDVGEVVVAAPSIGRCRPGGAVRRRGPRRRRAGPPGLRRSGRRWSRRSRGRPAGRQRGRPGGGAVAWRRASASRVQAEVEGPSGRAVAPRRTAQGAAGERHACRRRRAVATGASTNSRPASRSAAAPAYAASRAAALRLGPRPVEGDEQARPARRRTPPSGARRSRPAGARRGRRRRPSAGARSASTSASATPAGGSRTGGAAAPEPVEGALGRRLADELEDGGRRLVRAVGGVDGQVAVAVREDQALLGARRAGVAVAARLLAAPELGGSQVTWTRSTSSPTLSRSRSSRRQGSLSTWSPSTSQPTGGGADERPVVGRAGAVEDVLPLPVGEVGVRPGPDLVEEVDRQQQPRRA